MLDCRHGIAGLDLSSFQGDFLESMTWLHELRHKIAHDDMDQFGGEQPIGHKVIIWRCLMWHQCCIDFYFVQIARHSRG
jgi:hypothetical protein